MGRNEIVGGVLIVPVEDAVGIHVPAHRDCAIRGSGARDRVWQSSPVLRSATSVWPDVTRLKVVHVTPAKSGGREPAPGPNRGNP